MNKLKLTKDQKKILINTVRSSIEEKLFGKSIIDCSGLEDPAFSKHYGLFVTITADGNLRGCIGYIEGIKPIREAVKEMAIEAAFHDPRFFPLTKEEYKRIKIEISILYPAEEIKDINEIQVGRDGIILERGYHRGLLLPQVAIEYGWNREEFINQTCRKAGLEKNCWKNGAKVFKFEAEIFKE